MDRELTPTQLRVLCAIGIHTDRLGGNVWASVRTLAQEAGVVERTVQRACEELVERGYLRVVPRPGRTSLYTVVLEPPQTGDTAVTPDSGVTPPPTQLSHPTPDRAVSPKRPQGTTPPKCATREEVDALIRAYPDRPEPVVWPAVMKELNLLVQQRQPVERIIRAASRYRMVCLLNKTEPQYVKSLHRWLADGLWQAYDVITVHGRTREEWRLSGQDVLEFDRLAGVHKPEEVAL
jgi:DNA-binding transcriptional MocR family regulator